MTQRIPKRTGARRRGSILVLAAILMVVIMVIAAFSIDVGYVCLARAQLQNAADSAALAGAAVLADGPEAARAKAIELAGRCEAAGEYVVLRPGDVQLGRWHQDTGTFELLTGRAEEEANAVRVTCMRGGAESEPLRLFFGPVIGTSTVSASARATARIKSTQCGLMIGLARVRMNGSLLIDSYDSRDGGYAGTNSGSKGHLCSNGSISIAGSNLVRGDAHPGPGQTVQVRGASRVTGDKEPLEDPLKYPPIDPGDARTVNNNSSIPLSDRGRNPLNADGTFQLSGSDGVSIPPGTYYFTAIDLSGGVDVRITGPTVIYVAENVTLNKATINNLTQRPKNLQIYVMGSEFTMRGSRDFQGVIYAPSAVFRRYGSSDIYGAIVARDLVLRGSGGVYADTSLDQEVLQNGLQRSLLVE